MTNNAEETFEVDISERLTDPSQWNSLWTSYDFRKAVRVPPGRYRRIAERLFGSARIKQYFGGWEYFFWHRLLPRFVAPNRSARILELGSAPGDYLIEFQRLFGYAPYGVEYTSAGADVNRMNFAVHGIDPAQVFEADAFLSSFQDEHREQYDAVMSGGLIEHFTNVESVISAHVNLLKPGGLLIVSIPNLLGFNGWQVQRWAADLLPLHNLAIMPPANFHALFTRLDLDELFCAHTGGVNLLMADLDGASISPKTLSMLRKMQVLINVLQCQFGTVESRLWSPHLVYIGRKRNDDNQMA